LVFDTSGSMTDVVGKGTAAPWPQCEQFDAPLTKMGLSKLAFHTALQEVSPDAARWGLARFPQRAAFVPAPNCQSGYYEANPSGLVTGDPQKHSSAGPGDWFSANLEEVVVAPIPVVGSGIAEVLRWLDGKESVEVIEGLTCAECPGFCGYGCFAHTDPELRGDGSTPLGRTLYYAGEYLRRYVLVDGKPCKVASDCGSPHYSCLAGQCFDPAGACRRTEIVLFTDGDETEDTSEQSFFNPVNQAKRLFAGLACAQDLDCAPGSTCEAGLCSPQGADTLVGAILATEGAGICPGEFKSCSLGAFGACAEGSCVPVAHAYFDTEENVQALYSFLGQPLRVRVNVIDANPAASPLNQLIALWGGGEYVHATNGDPAQILGAIESLTIAKPSGDCE
jgi:hypothetical protein